MKNILKNICLNKKFLKLFFIVVVLFSVLHFKSFVAPADASINNQINFQGKLVNSNGTNVADSSYSVVFSLYTVSSGGAAIWTETDSVTTSSGNFQVALGTNTALPGNVDFNNSTIYLGIKVGTDAEMTPRIRFAAVPYAFNASTLDDVIATQSATGFTMQGGTSTPSVLSFSTAGSALTFQPGIAEGLTLQSNGANGLTIDTGGGAAISIGNNNATSIGFGKSANNTAFTFNNGTGGFTVNGTGSITLAALNSADGLIYTSGTNGVLSQTAPASGSQCLQSNSGNTALAWVACSGLGTNFWQVNSGAVSPANITNDFLLGGTSTTSARFAFINSVGAGTPTASVSAGIAGATSLTATGVLQTTANQGLTLGGGTTGNIFLNPDANNYVGIGTTTPAATLDVHATTGLNGGTIPIVSVSGATSFAGMVINNSGPGDLFTASKSGSTKFVITNQGNVGIGTAMPLAALDVRATSGTTPIASVAGSTTFAGLVVNNSGSGDLVTASSSGITRYRMTNSGSTVFQGDTLTSVGSLANNSAAVSDTNDSAVENEIGDEGSLVPNAGFESAITTNKTTNVAVGPVADGWVATATMSAAVTRVATTSAYGSSSVMIKLNASQSTSVSSVCIPLALDIANNYNLNFYANPSTTSPVIRGYIDGYANKANCQSNTSVTSFMGTAVTDTATSWKVYGGTTAVTTAGTNTWGRVRISVNCPASCGTGVIINIDGVRLIQTSNGVGLDYAEDYPGDPNNIPQPGQVVSLFASGSASIVEPATKYMDQSAIGVVSTNPGQVLDDGSMTNPVPIALAGRVPVNVSTVNGSIQVGDYLTSSTIPGVAVKATGAGPVIGTAMEADTDSNTSEVTQITMFVKNTYYSGRTQSTTDGLDLLSSTEDPSVVVSLLQGVMTSSSSAISSLSSGQITAGLHYLITAITTASSQSASLTNEIALPSSIPRNDVFDGTTVTATVSGLTVNGSATVSADLHVEGNALFEGILHIANTLFANNFIVNGVSDFFGNVIFHSGVTFENTPVFDSDTAGFAVIKKGSDHVTVTFTKPYDQAPIINATITFNASDSASINLPTGEAGQVASESAVLSDHVNYIITNRTKNGFTILLGSPAQDDISFSWVALAVNSPMIFQSNGQNIQLPSPTESVSPTPIDTIIPSTLPLSPTAVPSESSTPMPSS